MPSILVLAAIQIDIPSLNLRNHTFWAWILTGLIAGWLAGIAFRGRGFGCLTDIILGLVGSVIGGWLFTHFGILGGDFYYSLGAATLGAMILVGIARLFGGEKKSRQH